MKLRLLSIIMIGLMALVYSCTDGDDANKDTGRLSVSLTDAPFPHDLVAEANVTIFKIDARRKADKSEEGANNEDGSSFVVLMEDEISVNLLDLTNGITENLVNTDVAVGTYDLFRVYVEGVNVVMTDGTTYDLKVPSGAQTGIKVSVKPSLVVSGGLSTDLLLDFDVSKSFVAKGNRNDPEGINGFNFKPVIKASNLSTAGTLTGLVTTVQDNAMLGLEGAQVAVFAADTLHTTTFTDASGGYTVLGLAAGSYDVDVALEGYGSQTAEDIDIVAANKTVQDFELTVE
ncbi:Carboxypeptidase regulatory-like domain-containing protein [Arenibacter nanhaiticus]|uniref:Carboxypeptidase regulatory-like domain-containing protein n=1 Tax=Arenibacter nanhaiticus TaxID=558155 RepID=A0A1M6G7Z9_9FLAO|nr:DUF4382 domain-containing protein [Arenibacter nanhaiticus]SHJ06135.1 Carboxypeptidase regulatory-like domain-containing protein [Arenibacter nanhaiticus]